MKEAQMTTPDVTINEAGTPANRPLLEIRDLAITFNTSNGEVNAVRNAHLTIMPGETVAIVGESGSGKSTTALAAIGLLPSNGRVSAGQILLDGEDISHAPEKRMIELRGNTIGMVPQDPMSNLNPVWKIGYQVKETRRRGNPGRPGAQSGPARLSDRTHRGVSTLTDGRQDQGPKDPSKGFGPGRPEGTGSGSMDGAGLDLVERRRPGARQDTADHHRGSPR
jgi:ABC-type oligopeptide transport system ATPase subunit